MIPDDYVHPQYNIDKIKNESRVILIRHANSEFNNPYIDIKNKYGYGDEILNLYLNEKYIDSQITEFGVEQWRYASSIANELEIGTVFVSPLRRTMQTAYHLLNAHKDFDKIKFIMYPDVREHIFGTGEVSKDLEKLIKTQYSKYFRNLDYSYLLRNNPLINVHEIDELFYWRDVHPELQRKIEGKSKDEVFKL